MQNACWIMLLPDTGEFPPGLGGEAACRGEGIPKCIDLVNVLAAGHGPEAMAGLLQPGEVDPVISGFIPYCVGSHKGVAND